MCLLLCRLNAEAVLCRSHRQYGYVGADHLHVLYTTSIKSQIYQYMHVELPTCLCQLHWGRSREVGAFRLSCCAALEEPAACVPVLCFSMYAAASSSTRDLHRSQLYTHVNTHLQLQSGWYDAQSVPAGVGKHWKADTCIMHLWPKIAPTHSVAIATSKPDKEHRQHNMCLLASTFPWR